MWYISIYIYNGMHTTIHAYICVNIHTYIHVYSVLYKYAFCGMNAKMWYAWGICIYCEESLDTTY